MGTAAGQTGITVNTRQGGGPPDEWPSPFFVYLPMPLAASIDTKNPNPSPIGIRFGFLKCGGPNRDRTDDLTDAKADFKLFYMISNYLCRFLLGFSFFPPLFSTLKSMWYAAACGGSCGQKRSQPFAGNGFPAWTGSIFRAFVCLHCNSEGVIKPVISVPSMPQKLGGCKQKETFCFWRLRKLKRIFMRFHHSP